MTLEENELSAQHNQIGKQAKSAKEPPSSPLSFQPNLLLTLRTPNFAQFHSCLLHLLKQSLPPLHYFLQALSQWRSLFSPTLLTSELVFLQLATLCFKVLWVGGW